VNDGPDPVLGHDEVAGREPGAATEPRGAVQSGCGGGQFDVVAEVGELFDEP
jgi:hypothetical protein